MNDPGSSVVQQFSQVAPVSDTPTTVVISKTGHVVGMVGEDMVGAGNLLACLVEWGGTNAGPGHQSPAQRADQRG